jgi:penicillin-binding protein 1C
VTPRAWRAATTRFRTRRGSARARALTRPRVRRLVLQFSAAWGALAVVGVLWLRLGPLPEGLLADEQQPSTLIVDRRGEPLFEARSSTGLRGLVLHAHDVPVRLARATEAAEDRRYRWHPGVDPMAIVRAAYRNVRAGRIVQGGSTITQQVAELLIRRQAGSARRGWRAKIHEAVVAVRLEHRLSKDEILAIYLNLAPYGNQIQGAGRAATAYFGRTVGTLTAAECAFLAALPQQPSRFNPWQAPDRAIRRQHEILTTMADRGWITPAEHVAARNERLHLERSRSALVAPHFVERVVRSLDGTRPRRIDTTLDADLQRAVAGVIAAERESLRRHHAENVAVAVLHNATGEWLAWEGSGDYFNRDHGGAIDGVIAPRQPGSALKPFTYAAAFERGVHPGHVLADVPSQFPTAEPGILYSPRNYDGQFRGPLLARAALAGSENVPAVALASEIGVPSVARLLRRVGLTTLGNNAAHYGLGLTLGNSEVRLDELVAAYAAIARGGEYVAPRMIRSIDGRRSASAPAERVLTPRTAFWITDILSDSNARAYIFGQGGSLDFPYPVAAKTGTSQSYFDNWVIGYTREVTVGVWVGNFDRTPLRGSSGVTGAGPIFHGVMQAAVEHVTGSLPLDAATPLSSPPSDVRRAELCATSGMAAGAACPTRLGEWIAVEASDENCTWHHASDRGLITVWPEAYRDWARSAGLLPASSEAVALLAATALEVPGSATRAGVEPAIHVRRGRLTITRPLGGALFLFDPSLRPEFQTLTFSAVGGDGPLEWFVNGVSIGVADADRTVRWPLVRGNHRVLVRDQRSASAETTITVR